MRRIIAILASCLISTSFAFTLKNSDYGTLPLAVQSSLSAQDASKIQVSEFFSLACPHCYKFEPVLEKWESTAPKEVVLVRYPVGFGQPLWQLLARAYYTAIALDKKPLVDGMFNAIHKDHQPLFTKNALAGFFANNGVSRVTFGRYFNSFSITRQVKNADALVKAAKIMEVPTVVIDGRYYTNPGKAAGFKRMIEVINALVQKAQHKRAGH